MKRTAGLVLSACLLIFSPLPVLAQGAKPIGDLEITSRSLGVVILGKDVSLMLHDGTFFEGKAIHAGQEEIVIQVKKVEPPRKFPNSQATIRTLDVGVVHMDKNGSVAAPIALGVVGGLAGMLGSAYLCRNLASGFAALPIILGGAGGGAALGAIGGRNASRRTVTIVVVPDRD